MRKYEYRTVLILLAECISSKKLLEYGIMEENNQIKKSKKNDFPEFHDFCSIISQVVRDLFSKIYINPWVQP